MHTSAASVLVHRTLGVTTANAAHSAALELAGCAFAPLITGAAAVNVVVRALDDRHGTENPLACRVRRRLDERGYRDPVRRTAFALAAAICDES